MNIVVRDALGKVTVFPFDTMEPFCHGATNRLTIKERSDESVVAWYAPGQWVSMVLMDDSDLEASRASLA